MYSMMTIVNTVLNTGNLLKEYISGPLIPLPLKKMVTLWDMLSSFTVVIVSLFISNYLFVQLKCIQFLFKILKKKKFK